MSQAAFTCYYYYDYFFFFFQSLILGSILMDGSCHIPDLSSLVFFSFLVIVVIVIIVIIGMEQFTRFGTSKHPVLPCHLK